MVDREEGWWGRRNARPRATGGATTARPGFSVNEAAAGARFRLVALKD